MACSNAEVTAPENVPADHTVRVDGAFHAPGLQSPLENCVRCHGADLQGGENGEPSCFRCHGQKWSGSQAVSFWSAAMLVASGPAVSSHIGADAK